MPLQYCVKLCSMVMLWSSNLVDNDEAGVSQPYARLINDPSPANAQYPIFNQLENGDDDGIEQLHIELQTSIRLNGVATN